MGKAKPVKVEPEVVSAADAVMLLMERGSKPRSIVSERVIERVQEFIDVFAPGDGNLEEELALWNKLVEEELNELLDAKSYENLAKEIADLHYVVAGLVIKSREAGVPVTMPDGAADAAYNTSMLLGSVLEAMVDEVHASNMTKLGEDGEPVRREDGKILKGPNYKEADMKRFGDVLRSVVKAAKWERKK